MEGFVIHLKSVIFIEKTLTNSKKETFINRLEIKDSINFILLNEFNISPIN